MHVKKKWLAVNGLNQRLLFYSLSCYKPSSCICYQFSFSYLNHSSSVSPLYFILVYTLLLYLSPLFFILLSTLLYYSLSCLKHSSVSALFLSPVFYILALSLHLPLHFTVHCLFNLFMFGAVR